MTDEQINQKIAEVCGWKGNVLDRDMEGNLWPSYTPLYCADLNAMHEAEKVLSPRDEGMYFLTLKQLVGDLIWYRDTCRNYRATARERAEAFLRALGKWEEATTEESSVDHIGERTEMIVKEALK